MTRPSPLQSQLLRPSLLRTSLLRTSLLLTLLLLLFSGCAVAPAKGPLVSVPKERATECKEICHGLDLRLGAVVVIMNHTGCVCEVPDGAASRAAITAAGGAAIQLVAQQQERQEQEQNQQQNKKK